jgi:hypothetical protein
VGKTRPAMRTAEQIRRASLTVKGFDDAIDLAQLDSSISNR